MEDFSVVDSGDQSIGNGADGFIEVLLGGECVRGGLRGERWVLWGNGSLYRVKWDGQQWGGRWGLAERFIGSIVRVVRYRSNGEQVGKRDCEVKVCKGMELQGE
jgi:hypothetical protein